MLLGSNEIRYSYIKTGSSINDSLKLIISEKDYE